jgi:DNA-binding FadR family transcriptional regulator
MDFHCRIAAEAGNTYVLENIRATLIRMSRFTMYPRQGAGALAWVEHRAVTEAIRAGNPDEAANAMRTHLATGLERITSAIH